MGQAKRRGTYEERRQQAIARRTEEDAQRAVTGQPACYTKPPRRRSARDVTMLAALLGAGFWGGGR